MESPNSPVCLIYFPPLSALTISLQTCPHQILAIFPGYYTGRATHIHAKVFPEWTVIKENNTYKGGRLSHVGQFFFDEELNEVIDKVCPLFLSFISTIFMHPVLSLQMYPYVMNHIKDTIGRTQNAVDVLNIFGDSQGPEGKYNPVFKVHLLGGVVSQGLIGYITMVYFLFLNYGHVTDGHF